MGYILQEGGIRLNKKTIFLLRILLITGVAAQVVIAICYAANDTYAMESVKYATAVYDGNSFMLNAPVMSLIGLICRGLKIHPLTYVHNVLPVILIPLAYGAYYYLLGHIFSDEDDKALRYVSLLVLYFINIYGYWSGPLSKISLLSGYFTGQGIVMNIALPVCAALLLNKVPGLGNNENTKSTENIEDNNDEYLEEWDMKKHPIINARNIAIALVILVIIQMASIFVLNNKINSLYDATVNLQNQLNEYVEVSPE